MVVPPTARILGGAEGGPGGLEMVVVTLPQAPGEAAEAVAVAATRAGWTPQSMPQHAHVPIPGTRAFCFGRRLLAVMVTARPEGAGSSATIAHHVDGTGAHTACNPVEASDHEEIGGRGGAGAGPDRAVPAVIPPLHPPANARPHLSSQSGSGDTQDWWAQLETSAGSAELATHYAAALVQAGWTAADSVSVGPMVLRAFHLRDADGRDWHGWLTVTALGETAARDVVFRARRAPSAN